VQLWDVDSQTQVRAPIPAPAISDLIGFDADGYLAVVRDVPGTSSGSVLAFVDVDPDAGFESGAIEVGTAIGPVHPFYLSDDRRFAPLLFSVEGRGLDLPLTAQAWRDGLCSVVDRPFTPGERQLLPEGISTEPACR
jgi:hypothetical protein